MTWFVLFLILGTSLELSSSSRTCRKYGAPCKEGENSFRCCNEAEKCLLEPEFQEQHLCLFQSILGSPCTRNGDCMAIIGAKCSQNGTCTCRKGFREFQENFCVKERLEKNLELRRVPFYSCEGNSCVISKDFKSKSKQRRESKSIYGENCGTDADCSEIGTKCVEGECKCGTWELFDGTLGCRPAEICWNEIGCAGNFYCEFGRCRCKEFHFLVNGSCVMDEKFHCADGYFDPVEQKCSKFAENFGDYCGSISGCSKLSIKTTCRDFKCQCPEDQIVVEGNCTLPLYGKCSSDKDCTVEGSECGSAFWGTQCRCKYGYPSRDRLKCLRDFKGLGESCEIPEACFGDDTTCLNGKCQCNEETWEKKGRCYPKLGNDCKYNWHCQIEGSHCPEHNCVCKEKRFPSEDRSKCLAVFSGIGDNCEVDKQCQEWKTSCIDGKCQCIDNYHKDIFTCKGLNGASCRESWQCWEGFTCDNGICQCPSTKDMSENGEHCWNFPGGVTDYCLTNSSCSFIPNTYCDKMNYWENANRCLCLPGYFEHNKRCLAEIGSKCSSDLDCGIEASICISETCTCATWYQYSESYGKCLPKKSPVSEIKNSSYTALILEKIFGVFN